MRTYAVGDVTTHPWAVGVDLTDAVTVVALITRPDGTTVTTDAGVTDPAAGVGAAPITAADTASTGDGQLRIRATWSDGTRRTYLPALVWRVVPGP